MSRTGWMERRGSRGKLEPRSRGWRLGFGLGLALGVAGLAGGCVSAPFDNIHDEVDTTEPWQSTVTIAGSLFHPSHRVTIEFATDKEGSDWEEVGETESSATSVEGTVFEHYPWEHVLSIPERFWFRGVSGGFRARGHARSYVEGGNEDGFLLGVADRFHTDEVCQSFRINENPFGDLSEMLRQSCDSGTLGPDQLVFEFRTSNFNDHCGREREACCTASPGALCDPDLICNQGNLRCEKEEPDPEDPLPPSEPGEPGGTHDDDKCVEGDIEIVDDFSPNECSAGFSVTGYRECFNGTWGPPKAGHCGASSQVIPGTQCFCDGAGADCGLGVGWPCDPGGAPCMPGAICQRNPAVTGGYACAGPLPPLGCCWTPQEPSVSHCFADFQLPPSDESSCGSASGCIWPEEDDE